MVSRHLADSRSQRSKQKQARICGPVWYWAIPSIAHVLAYAWVSAHRDVGASATASCDNSRPRRLGSEFF
ncbi:hypothetical protein [Lysobacter gummosus]|uniref:hypothetical protein n=1 Tax=Lysobacter gummosus TaxID=262324 RepID=UPI0036416145